MSTQPVQRTIFFVSDRTGITAETLGRGMMTQFDGVSFHYVRLPFLDTHEKMADAIARINAVMAEEEARPIVFSTLVNAELLEQMHRECKGKVFDLFDTFNGPLEAELGVKASRVMGLTHGIGTFDNYTARIEALNFALNNDDGISTKHYSAADIVLIGVSRSGKTPTSLYLALQFGIHAANYPLTEEDLQHHALPESLRPFRNKLFGLTIDPARLHQIRSERLPNSRYAELGQCRKEVQTVEDIYRREGLQFINTTHMSIEEISTTILHMAGLKRRLYN